MKLITDRTYLEARLVREAIQDIGVTAPATLENLQGGVTASKSILDNWLDGFMAVGLDDEGKMHVQVTPAGLAHAARTVEILSDEQEGESDD